MAKKRPMTRKAMNLAEHRGRLHALLPRPAAKRGWWMLLALLGLALALFVILR
jgi:hypothetical protein